MEFFIDINVLFPQDITRIVGNTSSLRRLSCNRWDESEKNVATVIDAMGAASAKAQGLHNVITTAQKFFASNQTLYIMKDGGCNSGKGAAIGIIKVGHKVLFLADTSGVLHEVEPLCVLDFYVHESRQRTGCGKRLFETMLEAEQKRAFEVAIDRPSPKFLSFLKKYYNLQSYVKQANNFVVFDQFFTTCIDRGPTSRRRSLQKGSIFPSVEPLSPLPLTNTQTGDAEGSVVPRVPVGRTVLHLHSNRSAQPISSPLQNVTLLKSLGNTSTALLIPTPTLPQDTCKQEALLNKDVPTTSGTITSMITATDDSGRPDQFEAPYLNIRNHGSRRRGQGTDWLNHSSLYGTGVPAVARATGYSRHQPCDSNLFKPGTLPATRYVPLCIV